jgi:hypothetical protein
MTDAISVGAAERHDVLVRPPYAGTFLLHVDFVNWTTGKALSTRTIPLNAS